MRQGLRVWVGVGVSVLLVLVIAGNASAAIPKKVSYQGRLTDTSGDPLPGEHTAMFAIYNHASEGVLMWSESKTITADSSGVFSTILGSVTPLDCSFTEPTWLEVYIDGLGLTPRREIVSVASALVAGDAAQAGNADSLGGLAPGSYAPAAHTHYYLAASDGNPVNALYVDADGRVGIGTTTPNAQLRVDNSSSAAGTITIFAYSSSTAAIESYGVRGEICSGGAGSPGAGVLGFASATAGGAMGVRGESKGGSGVGVFGWATDTSGENYGVKGNTSSPNGYSAYFTGGRNYFQGNVGIGNYEPEYPLHVETSSAVTGARAIYGVAGSTGTSQQVSGIFGETRTTASTNAGAGVWGWASAATGRAAGLRGDSAPATGTGVHGWATHSTGVNYGVIGETESSNGYAGYFLGGKNYFEGSVGVGTTAPTAVMDVSGSTGYNQVRMRTSYTPSSTTDTHGNVGDVAWDDDYVYVKTTEGWKRAALQVWGL